MYFYTKKQVLNQEEQYMQRCLELAQLGKGNVAPNPMVGCVIVHKDRIIGEGFHQEYGKAHAEVNAINAVKDKALLKDSTLYVNLEPCSHHGKTPPCIDLIIRHQIPHVVIGAIDVNPEVSGTGVLGMEKAGIKVNVGVLEEECWELNIRFYRFQEEKRPYIILKWAQTIDGFVDIRRERNAPVRPTWITGEEERTWVHKWRSEEQAIMAGSNTILKDNPDLTVRKWHGKNPVRVVLDRQGIIPANASILNKRARTLIFGNTEKISGLNEFHQVDLQNPLHDIMKHLYKEKIQSLFVEGGPALINFLIKEDLWDEARIFTGNKAFQDGVPAPLLKGNLFFMHQFSDSTLSILRNPGRVYRKVTLPKK